MHLAALADQPELFSHVLENKQRRSVARQLDQGLLLCHDFSASSTLQLDNLIRSGDGKALCHPVGPQDFNVLNLVFVTQTEVRSHVMAALEALSRLDQSHPAAIAGLHA